MRHVAIIGKHDVIDKKYIMYALLEEDQAVATGTCTGNFVKFGHVFEICKWTDIHTDTLIAILHTPTGG